jgi:tRNA(fMet)-specific endonuclease VapC
MAIKFLLDTNIFIYIRQRRPLDVLARFQALPAGATGLSVISYGELQYGAERSRNPALAFKALEEFAELIHVLPLPIAAGNAYAQIRRSLETRGEIIGANDLWIAAHAKAAELTLVTNNEREFKRVAGLKIENWIR